MGKEKFDRNKPALVEELTAQKIYRKIEGAKPRPLEESDLPAGAPIKITRYDYVIEGRLDTYRIDGIDTEPVTTRPFALWVRQKPLDVRTRENPQALEVADMNFIDVRPRTSASRRCARTSSGAPATHSWWNVSSTVPAAAACPCSMPGRP